MRANLRINNTRECTEFSKNTIFLIHRIFNCKSASEKTYFCKPIIRASFRFISDRQPYCFVVANNSIHTRVLLYNKRQLGKLKKKKDTDIDISQLKRVY